MDDLEKVIKDELEKLGNKFDDLNSVIALNITLRLTKLSKLEDRAMKAINELTADDLRTQYLLSILPRLEQCQIEGEKLPRLWYDVCESKFYLFRYVLNNVSNEELIECCKDQYGKSIVRKYLDDWDV